MYFSALEVSFSTKLQNRDAHRQYGYVSWLAPISSIDLIVLLDLKQ